MKLRTIIVLAAFAASLITCHLSLITYSRAQTPEELTQQLSDKQKQIRDLESHLAETKNQEKTLKSQLDVIDGQTQVTSLKIEETSLKIEKLRREIEDLSSRISRISTSVDNLSGVLLERIVKTYKSGSVSNLELIFASNGISDMLQRVKYLQVAQANDKKVLYQLQATKNDYSDRKQEKQLREQEALKLNKDLADFKDQLAAQKKDKEQLLVVTKNDEVRFQGLIAQLKADADSITRALGNVGVVIGPVKRGQQIGAEGTSGCSSGPHLHFEVYENAKVEGGRVVGNRVNPHKFLDNSQLGPPMQGYPGSTKISTEYGEVYALGVHTGLDIYDDAFVGTPILAAGDGTAYAVGDGGCRISGFDHGPAKGVVIDHGNGLVTLYWHLL